MFASRLLKLSLQKTSADIWIFNFGRANLSGLHDHVKKRYFSGLTAKFGSRGISLKRIFKAPGRKIIF